MNPRSMIAVHYMEPYARKRYYTVMMHGRSILTTVTSDPDVVSEWIVEVVNRHVFPPRRIGFEIEFDMETVRIGTLQFCIGNRCLIYQLPYAATFLPHDLSVLLGDQNNVLIGTHIGPKLGLLRAHFAFTAMVRGADFINSAPFMIDIKRLEIASSVPPAETNWDRLPLELSVRQAHHACLDAFLNLYIGEPLFLSPAFQAMVQATFYVPTITRHLDRPASGNTFYYDTVFLGHTIWITVTAHLETVEEWITALHCGVVGLEIEFDNHAQRVGTMQLMSANRCLIFQLHDTNHCPPALEHFLNTHTFAGDAHITEKTHSLRQQLGFEAQVASVDISEFVMEGWKEYFLEYIGLGAEEEEEDWSRPYLSDNQVLYAYFDVNLNIQIAASLGRA